MSAQGEDRHLLGRLLLDVEQQLAEFAGTLGRLADDLEGGFDVRPAEVHRVTERATASIGAVRFVQVMREATDGEPATPS
ncbi:unannotated protein [freshwater metagenome]|uniref:Unannotated protein n=1 Tax=freshwater metagenome TaxID=449393 RepID=A0A6J7KLP5_9ZZZZ|nr:hypothetical protein [Actinomycetota bacterium]